MCKDRYLPFLRPIVLVALLLPALGIFAQSAYEALFPGSYIIMGVTPQTDNNALRPYGMIYDLRHNHRAPIKRGIQPTIGRDGVGLHPQRRHLSRQASTTTFQPSAQP